MKRIAILLASALLLAGVAAAQETAPREKIRSFTFTQNEPITTYSPNFDMMFQRESMPEKIEFFSAEVASAGDVITGAPYTATAVTETTQTLADGNRIVNKTSGLVARDSQGRTRRETALHRIGPLQMDSPKTYFINDPTNHTQYVLTEGGEATKIVRSEQSWSSNPMIIAKRRAEEDALRDKKMVVARRSVGEPSEEQSKQVKHEDLGTQTIEGVSAEGKRETVTIAAGQIGNERPIEIVSETWFSPELHTVVMRRHSDPRVGETIFRLTDIKRNEPDASLFQPPAGTKMRVEPLLEMKREISPPK
jgi:hypothetical protein